MAGLGVPSLPAFLIPFPTSRFLGPLEVRFGTSEVLQLPRAGGLEIGHPPFNLLGLAILRLSLALLGPSDRDVRSSCCVSPELVGLRTQLVELSSLFARLLLDLGKLLGEPGYLVSVHALHHGEPMVATRSDTTPYRPPHPSCLFKRVGQLRGSSLCRSYSVSPGCQVGREGFMPD